MAITKRYQTAPQTLATYDYTDIAEGTGVVVFNGYSVDASGAAVDYLLSKDEVRSSQITTNAAPTGAAFVKLLDLDFDTTFNNPCWIRGTSKYLITNTGKGTTTSEIDTYLIIKLRGVISGDEEEIGSVQTESLTLGATVVGSRDNTVTIEIATPFYFAKGDTLRITVEVWGQRDGGTGGFCGVAHDPENRDDAAQLAAANYSTFEAHIPFVIDR